MATDIKRTPLDDTQEAMSAAREAYAELGRLLDHIGRCVDDGAANPALLHIARSSTNRVVGQVVDVHALLARAAHAASQTRELAESA